MDKDERKKLIEEAKHLMFEWCEKTGRNQEEFFEMIKPIIYVKKI